MVLSSFFEFSSSFISHLPTGVEQANPDPIVKIDKGFTTLLAAAGELEDEVLRQFIADILDTEEVIAKPSLVEAREQLLVHFKIEKEVAGLETIFSVANKGLDNSLFALYLLLALESPNTKTEIAVAEAYHPKGRFGMSADRDVDSIKAVCLDVPLDEQVELHVEYDLTCFCLAKPGSKAPESDKYSYAKGRLLSGGLNMPIWIAQTTAVNNKYVSLFSKYEINEVKKGCDVIKQKDFVRSAALTRLQESAAPQVAAAGVDIEDFISGLATNSFPYSTSLEGIKGPASVKDEPSFSLLDRPIVFNNFMMKTAKMPHRAPVLVKGLFKSCNHHPDYVLKDSVAEDITRFLSLSGQSSDVTARYMSKQSFAKTGDIFKQFAPFVKEISRLSGKADYIASVISGLMKDYSSALNHRFASECTFPETVFFELIAPEGLLSRVGEVLPSANYLEGGVFNGEKYSIALKIVAFLVGHHVSTRKGQKYTVSKVDEAKTYCIFFKKED